jgi:hypothetical protein
MFGPAHAVGERGHERAGTIDAVSTLKDVAKRLKELASSLQERKVAVAESDVRTVRDALSDFLDVYGIERWKITYKSFRADVGSTLSWFKVVEEASEREVGLPKGTREKLDKLRRPLEVAKMALDLAHSLMEECKGLSPGDQACIERAKEKRALRYADELALSVVGLTDRVCGSSVRGSRERYNLSSFLEDISDCLNSIAEWVQKSGLPSSAKRIGERCFATEGADKDLEDLCSLWDGKVREMAKKKAYLPLDEEALRAVVGPKEASFSISWYSPEREIRVGKGGWFWFYNHRGMPYVSYPVRYLLWKAAGYSCKGDLGVLECDPADPNALRSRDTKSKLADIISWVPSANERLSSEFRSFCREKCFGYTYIPTKEEEESCLKECIEGINWEDVLRWNKLDKGERGEAVEPHPVTQRDLEQYGITWWKETRR